MYTHQLKFERYLFSVEKSPRTVPEYSRDVRLMFEHVKRSEPANVTRAELVDWLGAMKEAELSPATRCRRIASVRKYYRFLRITIEGFTADPCKDLDLPKIPERRVDTLTPEQVDVMLSIDPGDDFLLQRARLAGELLYSNGLRLAELASLRYGSVDTETGLMRVIGKGNKERAVVLSERARLLLLAWKVQYPKEAEAPLFFSEFGYPVKAPALRQDVYRLAEKAGIGRDAWPHLFRSSITTHLIDAGANEKTVQMMLGQSSSTTMKRHYQGVNEQAQRHLMKLHPRDQEV